MTVRLRPHHLLCMLTYAGKGYSPAFTANMTAVVGRIAGGEEIQIVSGPDDICAPLLSEPDPHCHRESVTARDKRAAAAVERRFGNGLSDHIVLERDDIEALRQAFASGDIRSACRGCEWQALCTDIAGDGFAGTLL
tara:strand:+ start:271 stop:681 length:411 start_codon:yes stop_codon:yes gene_type:complete